MEFDNLLGLLAVCKSYGYIREVSAYGKVWALHVQSCNLQNKATLLVLGVNTEGGGYSLSIVYSLTKTIHGQKKCEYHLNTPPPPPPPPPLYLPLRFSCWEYIFC